MFKSVGSISRSASAAKTLWGPAGANQQVPSFFMSTPQFKRQQHQVAVYREDARGAQAGSQLGSPHGGVAVGGASYSTIASSSLEDDKREDAAGVQKLGKQTKAGPGVNAAAMKSPTKLVPPRLRSAANGSNAKQTAIEDEEESDRQPPIVPVTADELLAVLRSAHDAGEHARVLQVFSVIEEQQAMVADLSVDAYNVVLESVAQIALEAEDMAVLLQTYERLLQRDIVPNRHTYGIVIAALTEQAQRLAARRAELRPITGHNNSDELEAAAEVLEGLAVEDHLRLALEIFRASVVVDASNFDQAAVDALVYACCAEGVACSDVARFATPAAPLFSQALTLPEATQLYRELPAESVDAQAAYLRRMLELGHQTEAFAFFDSAGAPSELVQTLSEGLVRNGLVATAARWARTDTAKAPVLNAARLLESVTDTETLPSAMALFETAAARRQLDVASRSAIVRLCVAANNLDALFLVVRESKLRQAMWDPTAVIACAEFLVLHGEPMLATDIVAWQMAHLEDAWTRKGVESFLGQELVQRFVSCLEKADALSLEASLTLAPFAVSSNTARERTFESIWAARSVAPDTYKKALASSESNSAQILDAHARWVLTCVRGPNIAMPEQLRQGLNAVFGKLVEDVLVDTVDVSFATVERVQVVLALLGESRLQQLWPPKRTFAGVSSTTNSTPNTSGQPDPVHKDFSAEILAYARTPDGIDTAMDLVERSSLQRLPVSGPALQACVNALTEVNEPLSRLDELVAQCSLSPEAASLYLNSIVQSAAGFDWPLAQLAFHRLDGLTVQADSYAALVRRAPTDTQVIVLLNDARARGVDLNANLVNAGIVRLARARRLAEVAQLRSEAEAAKLSLSSDTHSALVHFASVRGDETDALALLDAIEASRGQAPHAVAAYNDVIQFYVKRGNREAALKVFSRLRDSGALPTPHSYKLVMEAYLECAPTPELDHADRVLALMRHDGAPISTQCLATLLRARGVLMHDFESARNFYRGLVKNSRVLPDKRIFKALLESYLANGRKEETPLVLKEMAKYHVPLDGELSRTLEQAA